jgi:uncharacterized protein
MAYLDTSVIVAYYCPEELSEKAESVILKTREPVISTLTAVEFASAISRKLREKGISPTDARSVWNRFDYHRTSGYYCIKSLEIDHYNTAASFIMQFKSPLRTLDALHLALAGDASGPIITADIVLARSAEKIGIRYELIR